MKWKKNEEGFIDPKKEVSRKKRKYEKYRLEKEMKQEEKAICIRVYNECI